MYSGSGGYTHLIAILLLNRVGRIANPTAMLPVSSVIGDRLGYYLLPIQAMIFARAPFLRTGLNRNFVILAPYLGFLLFFGVWTTLSHHFSACYLPYQTWLFGFPDFSRYY